MKYFLLLILTTLIVLSGCSKLINENVKENSDDIIGVEKPMEYISNHFLDQAILRLGIIDSGSREMEQFYMSWDTQLVYIMNTNDMIGTNILM